MASNRAGPLGIAAVGSGPLVDSRHLSGNLTGKYYLYGMKRQ
jgi:hypothetical protein